MKTKTIRVIVLGLIVHHDRLFLSEGFDAVKQETFYRALGGGVEFGETCQAALQREFQEELQAELTNIRYLACLENLFTFMGEPGHELVQLYQCDFVDSYFYQNQPFTFIEGDNQCLARWVDIDQLKSNALRLVPEDCLAYLL
ncbi:NUDIX hydrolase [Myxacorys almedinensis]|uniref:NUDIX domain-containing protein n=1 Tax=Myxacorys almedinensis A TaxID=2690445 RepID=A0A8J7Z8E3_9CYAN|nr:NUDIX hydrolase [Myxacorys almedinensis]NDJ18283.1 NUDIX domain-containing protein [Myxacorys almedinensis A]